MLKGFQNSLKIEIRHTVHDLWDTDPDPDTDTDTDSVSQCRHSRNVGIHVPHVQKGVIEEERSRSNIIFVFPYYFPYYYFISLIFFLIIFLIINLVRI